jgi:transcriptional regulator with XRE-family HTH domain
MPPRTRSPHHAALGAAVRELRARQGVSQEELGFRCGLHRNYVGAVERGELNPTYGVLLRLCAGFGIALAELTTLAERRAAGDVRYECPAPGRARRTPARARALPLWDGRLTPRSSAAPPRPAVPARVAAQASPSASYSRR